MLAGLLQHCRDSLQVREQSTMQRAPRRAGQGSAGRAAAASGAAAS